MFSCVNIILLALNTLHLMVQRLTDQQKWYWEKLFSQERERERDTHTHTHQISFLNKRHIEVQDRCSIRFWCMIQGENITIEGACLSHDIKTAKHRKIFLFYQRNC